jgi:hypothetical protein
MQAPGEFVLSLRYFVFAKTRCAVSTAQAISTCQPFGSATAVAEDADAGVPDLAGAEVVDLVGAGVDLAGMRVDLAEARLTGEEAAAPACAPVEITLEDVVRRVDELAGEVMEVVDGVIAEVVMAGGGLVDIVSDGIIETEDVADVSEVVVNTWIVESIESVGEEEPVEPDTELEGVEVATSSDEVVDAVGASAEVLDMCVNAVDSSADAVDVSVGVVGVSVDVADVSVDIVDASADAIDAFVDTVDDSIVVAVPVDVADASSKVVAEFDDVEEESVDLDDISDVVVDTSADVVEEPESEFDELDVDKGGLDDVPNVHNGSAVGGQVSRPFPAEYWPFPS